jgi:phosphate transport system ATP-binding protein
LNVIATELGSVRSVSVGPLMEIRDLSVWYHERQALMDVNFDLFRGEVLSFIGPSGCGKTTALKCLNRMLEEVAGVRITGSIKMEGVDIHTGDVDLPEYRREFGWVAQKPNPFAATIYENIAYGARIHRIANDGPDMDAHVESCLRRAYLWDEVKDVLHEQDGSDLSGGQQQRLCIARALGTDPTVLLMDEPTGSIDPIVANEVERLILSLRATHAIVLVTHSMMEAHRVSDRVAMFYLGRLVEIGFTDQMFANPRVRETQNFISGIVG